MQIGSYKEAIKDKDSALPDFVTRPVDVVNNPSAMDATSSHVSFNRLGLKGATDDDESAFERIFDKSEQSS